jgi:Mg-chelatase subunit ChlD
LLLDELSAADAARVGDIMRRDPEWARLYAQLQVTIPLAREATQQPQGATATQPSQPRLSPERRDALLAALKTVPLHPLSTPPASPARPSAATFWLPLAAAAAIVALLGAATLLIDSPFGASKSIRFRRLNTWALLDPPGGELRTNTTLEPGRRLAGSAEAKFNERATTESERLLEEETPLVLHAPAQPLAKPGAFEIAHLGAINAPAEADTQPRPRVPADAYLYRSAQPASSSSPQPAQPVQPEVNRAWPGRTLGRDVTAPPDSEASTQAFRRYALAPVPAPPAPAQQSVIALEPNAPSADALFGDPARVELRGRAAGFGGAAQEPAITPAENLGKKLEQLSLTDNAQLAARPTLPALESRADNPPATAAVPAVLQPPPHETYFAAPDDAKEKAAVRFGTSSLATAAPAAAAPRGETESLQRQLSESAEALDKAARKQPAAHDRSAAFLPDVPAAENPFSTFSLNVTDVSFKLAAAALDQGQYPEPASVRPEEFINAFDYRDPEPSPGAPVGFAWERARSPFEHDRDLLRFSVRSAAQGREAARPLQLVLLVDNSGSMERADRVQILRETLRLLAGQLGAADRVSLISFARTAQLHAEGISGERAQEIAERVISLRPDGGTNLEEALRLAYATAERQFLATGVNRVILLTDGAANLGEVRAGTLQHIIQQHRRKGIALDCFGIGFEGYHDELLAALSRHGDGRYGFVNTPADASTNFVAQLAGALQVAAADLKVQVEFHPDRVMRWRQIGYAKDQLTKEQFRDDTVDAAELGAAESGNALYSLQLNPSGRGPIATVRIRFHRPGSSRVEEHAWTVPYAGQAVALDRSSPALRLSVTAAGLAELLAASPYAAGLSPDHLLGALQGVPDAFAPDPRPRLLQQLLEQTRAISNR